MGNLPSYFSKPKNNGNVLLPEEVILSEILPKLPVKSLMRFKCVSKKWFDQITNHSSFKKVGLCNHSDTAGIIILAKYNFDRNINHKMFLLLKDDNDDKNLKVAKIEMSYLFEEGVQKSNGINVLGSSNGLVLLSNIYPKSHSNLILWNPVTRDFRNVPKPILLTQGVDYHEILQQPIMDLGFDQNSGDHKIIRVLQTSSIINNNNGEGGNLYRIKCLNFQVFSKKRNRWRKLNPLSGFMLWNLDLGVSLNGTFNFLAMQVNGSRTCVLSFDFRDDEIRDVIDVPESLGVSNLSTWKENSLALIALNYASMPNIEFWVMNNRTSTINDDHDHGHQRDHYYWHKLFTLDNPNYFRVLNTYGVWMDQFLVVQHHRRWRGTELRLWDQKRRKTSKLVKVGPLWFFSSVHSFVPSLVSVYPDDHDQRKVREEIERN